MGVNEVLRPSRPGEEPRLKALWKACFGDEDWYIDRYFDRCYTPGQAMVLEADGEVVSMLLVFPQEAANPYGGVLPFWYVYAFCTHPEAQSRGFGRRLLGWTEERAAEAGMRGVVMVPGEKSLFDFYATLGYETLFSVREARAEREEVESGYPVTPCPLEKYLRMREDWLRSDWHVRYPESSARWQEQLCTDSGGGLYQIQFAGIAAVERSGDLLVVKELLSDAPGMAVQSLLLALDGKRALVRIPVSFGVHAGRIRPFGVMKWLDAAARDWWQARESGWLAFAFD